MCREWVHARSCHGLSIRRSPEFATTFSEAVGTQKLRGGHNIALVDGSVSIWMTVPTVWLSFLQEKAKRMRDSTDWLSFRAQPTTFWMLQLI